MIGYLEGRILQKNIPRFILGVGAENTGYVGYSVQCPQNAKYLNLQIGSQAAFFVYTHVKEDILDLFGFLEESEKLFFQQLLSVSGIGPKLAMSLLSAGDAGTVRQWIATGDRVQLSGISGIGKKTAERIILELKDKMTSLSVITASGAVSMDRSAARDTKDALLQLGFKESDFSKAIETLFEPGRPSVTVEQAVREVLRRMS